MLEDIWFVEQYFGMFDLMLNPEAIVDTKRSLTTSGWWQHAMLEDVLEILFKDR